MNLKERRRIGGGGEKLSTPARRKGINAAGVGQTSRSQTESRREKEGG